MSIVTGSGDDGYSSLSGGARVAKNHPRLEAYGVVDEAQSAIGMVRAIPDLDDGINKLLASIQNDLFVLGSDLATVNPDADIPRIDQKMVEKLEAEIKSLENSLPQLKNFILPSGTTAASTCFWVRAVVRRAEREVTDILTEGGLVKLPLVYLNRLSDLLFLVARQLNQSAGVDEESWSG